MFRAMSVYAALRLWIAAVAVAVTILATPAERAAASDFTIADIERVRQLVAEEKCGEAWDALWTATLRGSPVATELIAMSVYLGLYAPMPLPREDLPEGDEMLKDPMMHFSYSAAFATDVRKLPKGDLDALYDGDRQAVVEDVLSFRKSFLKEFIEPNVYKEFEAEWCLSKQPSNKCFDPKGWGLPILSLTDWDGQLEEYKAKGFKAVCFPPRP